MSRWIKTAVVTPDGKMHSVGIHTGYRKLVSRPAIVDWSDKPYAWSNAPSLNPSYELIPETKRRSKQVEEVTYLNDAVQIQGRLMQHQANDMKKIDGLEKFIERMRKKQNKKGPVPASKRPLPPKTSKRADKKRRKLLAQRLREKSRR